MSGLESALGVRINPLCARADLLGIYIFSNAAGTERGGADTQMSGLTANVVEIIKAVAGLFGQAGTCELTICDIGVACDPATVCGTPVDIIVMVVKYVLEGGG